ncbi:MAG: T9SS type A sorting domain-containing protein [Balneolaceae bacterium]
MAKKLYIVLPVFLSLFGSKLSAQDSVKTPYFPYQTGDFWVNEIYIAGQYETDERIDIISDSVTPNGEYVFTVSSERGQPEELIYNFKIDSTNNIYSDWWYDKGVWMKIFDASKKVGDVWILEKDSITPTFVQYDLAEVMVEYRSKIFGESTTVKEVRYARTDNDSTSTQEGYGRFYVWWSEKFGMLEKRSLELPGIEPVLKGASIRRTIYGDTTANLRSVSIEPEPSGNSPQSFQLSNYPNPFNSSTNFVIETETPSRFTLEVYDRVGRKVTEIFSNKQLASGRHMIPWQAGNLATGMYFARLSSLGGVQVQTITYLK